MTMYLTARDLPNPHTQATLTAPDAKSDALDLDNAASCQTLLGFGGAFTEAAALCFQKLGKENQQRVLRAYFHPQEGLGYSLGRVAIGSCDFSPAMYDYITPGDTNLDSFDISHEEKAVLPFLRAAEKARGAPLHLLASPWSPPAFMKDNHDRKHGGSLLPQMASAWAKYYVRFIQEMRKRGASVAYLSVQNEPAATQTWDSCRYTAQEERDFIKNHLGPALAQAGLADIKLLIHDHNRDILLERALPILDDPEAARYIWGTALHWYVSENFAASAALHGHHPHKHLLFTEGCVEGGPAPGNWQNGERYARNIIGDLNHWVEGWLDWNLLLDAQGGPNHVGNYCCAPILCDPDTDTLTMNPSYHFIAHFARYIRPGAVRLASAGGNPDIKTLCVRNPDGAHVLVALNETDEAQNLNILHQGKTLGVSLPPHAIATVAG